MNFKQHPTPLLRSYLTNFLAIGGLFMTTATLAEDVVLKQFSAQKDGRLSASVIFDRIFLEAHAKDTIELRLVRSVKPKFLADEQTILREHEASFEQKGDEVRIRIHPSNTTLRRWNQEYGRIPLDSELYVRVPSEFDTSLNSVSGSMEIGKVGGQLNVETVSGRVTIQHVEGDVDVSTVSGQTRIQSATGDSKLASVSGSIHADEIKGDATFSTISGSTEVGYVGGDLKSKSTSGRIAVVEVMGDTKADSTSGGVQINYVGKAATISSVSGSVAVGLPREGGHDLQIKTRSGKITTDLQVDGQIKPREINGTVNGGGDKIVLKTVSGKVIASEVDS